MKKIPLLLTVLLLCLLTTNYSYADTIYADDDGDWHDGSTWQGGVVPSAGDDVVIGGFSVTFTEGSGDVTVNRIYLNNANGAATGLILTGSKTLTVITEVIALSTTVNNIVLKLENQSVLSVLGNLTFERVDGSSLGEEVYLNIKDQSRLTVGGIFTFNYDVASASELSYEIKIEDSGELFVLGDMNLISRGGHSFEMNIWESGELTVNGDLVVEMLGGVNMDVDLYNAESKIQVNGDLNLINHTGLGGVVVGGSSNVGAITINENVNIDSKGDGFATMLGSTGASAVLEVKSDINLRAAGNASAVVKIANEATLKLGGTISRDGNGFGVLKMDETSMLELNGTGPQVIPPSKMVNNNVDSLYITNMSFNNTSGQPIILMGPLYVNDYLDLSGGILKTTSTNILVMGENATIDQGSKTSYVDGPIRKIGGTKGASFVFPTGDDDVYAPIEISPILGTDALGGTASVYTAEYTKGDPPPFGELPTGIKSITDNQYWTLDNDGGVEQISITLHWTDPAALGLENVADLLVVGYNTTMSTWTNFGNQEAGGSALTDDPGYVMSMDGDPPPFGEHQALTIGSTVPGTLPVELLRFQAVQEVDEVYLHWETASEDNASHFIVEHSIDGHTFETLRTIDCRGGEELSTTYSAEDTKPYYGSNFYRLKIVDRDGSFEYSSIEVVKFAVVPVLSLYPNPVQGFLNLEVGGESDGEGMMEVFDRNGSQIYLGGISFENGTFQISTATMNVYTPGTYVIRIIIDQREQVLKFIKLK